MNAFEINLTFLCFAHWKTDNSIETWKKRQWFFFRFIQYFLKTGNEIQDNICGGELVVERFTI